MLLIKVKCYSVAYKSKIGILDKSFGKEESESVRAEGNQLWGRCRKPGQLALLNLLCTSQAATSDSSHSTVLN